MSEYVVEWHQSPGGWVVWTAPGGRVMVQRVEPGNLTPDEARDLATALLAAARASEAQSSDPAVEAAQRAWAAMAQDMPWTDGGECEELVTAAREALAPSVSCTSRMTVRGGETAAPATRRAGSSGRARLLA